DLFQILSDMQENLAFLITEDHSIQIYQGLAFKKTDELHTKEVLVKSSYGEFLDKIYEEEGALQQQLTNYEKRDGQRQMSEHIYDAFQLEHHALIEAETGTGKSLGYLLPTIYEAIKTDQRIVISTFTTQLQNQLLEED